MVNTEPMSQRRYRRLQGTRCPFCRSPEIAGGPIDIVGAEAQQEMACNACDKIWLAVYTLTRYAPT